MEVRRTTHANRQLKKLPKAEQMMIREAEKALADWPQVTNVKRLKDRDDYRLRVGRYRVFFEIIDGAVVITQITIRDERTYQ